MIDQKTRKEEITEAAAALFREKGYAAATMRDLAEKVGIEAASLYNHIDSKEQLLEDICFEIGQLFMIKMREAQKSNLSNTEKLIGLIETHIDITTTHAAMVSVANEDWRHLTDPQLSAFLEMREDYEQKFLQIIQNGIDHNELKVKDATIALYTILSSVRWLQYWYRSERKVSKKEIKSQIINLLMKGLSK